MGVAHCDVKPAQIMITAPKDALGQYTKYSTVEEGIENSQITLLDYGASGKLGGLCATYSPTTSDPETEASHSFDKGGGVNYARVADVHGVGATMCLMLAPSRPVLRAERPDACLARLRAQAASNRKPCQTCNLINKMTKKSPTLRMGVDDAMRELEYLQTRLQDPTGQVGGLFTTKGIPIPQPLVGGADDVCV